jgi:exopolysaccharide production protein ExoQ
MNPHLAAFVYTIFIAGLFWLDRDRKVRTSKALLIPLTWFLIVGSRPVSEWFNNGPSIATSENLEGSPIDAAIFGSLLAMAILVLVWRHRRVAPFLMKNWLILLFFAYCLLSTLWAESPFISFKRWTKAIGDLSMVLVVLTDLNPVPAMKRIYTWSGFILLPLSVLFIKYFPDIGRSYNPWTWTPMFGGVTLFKNMLGMTCLICGLGSVWCAASTWIERRGKDRLRHIAPHVIIATMAVWLFFLADSKTSLSCYGFGAVLILVTTLTRAPRRAPALVHLLAAGAIALSLLALFAPSLNLVASLGRDSTLTGRTNIWAGALSVVTNPLFGAGFESFWEGPRLIDIWKTIHEVGIQEAHNGYLEVYLNLGWLGVSLLSLLIVTGYRNATRAMRRDPRSGGVRVALCVVTLIYALTEAGFRMLSLTWISFLLATTTVPQLTVKKGRAPSHTAPAEEQTGKEEFLPEEVGANAFETF